MKCKDILDTHGVRCVEIGPSENKITHVSCKNKMMSDDGFDEKNDKRNDVITFK